MRFCWCCHLRAVGSHFTVKYQKVRRACVYFLKNTSCVWEELSWGGGMWGEHLAHFSTVGAVILASRSCGNEIKLSCHVRKLSLTCAARNLWRPKVQSLVTCYCAGWQLYSASKGGINRWREWRFDFFNLWIFFFKAEVKYFCFYYLTTFGLSLKL